MIDIILVDDHPIFREGLKSRLNLTGQFNIVGEASNGKDALELIGKTEFDVVLMDINMPQMSGMYVLELIKERGIECKVLS